jgi:ketosteroid isomerase-like protein
MSQENVEVVERAYAHFERGNFWPEDVFHPHVRVAWASDLITGGRESVGVEQFAQDTKEWLGPWEGATATAERIIDVGDQVVVTAVWRARGKASDAVAEWRQGHVWTLREGKAVHLVGYGDPTEALAAVGLRE